MSWTWYSSEASVLQVVLLAFGGPLALGVMAKVRARAEGRVGSPITQPWRDLRKLLRKETLHVRPTSVVSRMTPYVVFVSTTLLVAMTPLVSTHPLLGGGADAFVVVYLLLTGSVFLALAGLDAATAFGGMGASRAATIGALAEPALLVSVLALSVSTHSSNLPRIVEGALANSAWMTAPSRLLAFGALAVVVVAETGRLPVDNPTTHLELTMIHEAMILEFAGTELAVITEAMALRFVYLVGLTASLFIPWGIATTTSQWALLLGAVALAVKVLILVLGITLVEIRMAKLRLFRVPELLAGAFVLSVVAVVTGLVSR